MVVLKTEKQGSIYAARQEIVAYNNNAMLNPIIKKMQRGGLRMVSFHVIVSCLVAYNMYTTGTLASFSILMQIFYSSFKRLLAGMFRYKCHITFCKPGPYTGRLHIGWNGFYTCTSARPRGVLAGGHAPPGKFWISLTFSDCFLMQFEVIKSPQTLTILD